MTNTAKEIPVVDIAPFRRSASRPRVDEEIPRACVGVGFFCLRGHGVDRSVIEKAWRQSKAFFLLPLDCKLSVAGSRASYRG